MICRPTNDGWIFITQDDHARLAGDLAQHVGNEWVHPAMPLRDVISAIAMHDIGWIPLDATLLLDGDGHPRDTFHMPLPAVLPLWADSVEQAIASSPYAGLLVSLHMLGLAVHAARQKRADGSEVFLLNQFQHRQVEIQEKLRHRLDMCVNKPLRFGLAEPGRSPDEDLLLRNHQLMQTMDRISLVLSFDKLIFNKIDSFFPEPGGKPITLDLARPAENHLHVSPWPFDADEVTLHLPARNVRQKTFANSQDAAAAIAATPVEKIVLTVSR